MTRWGAVVVGWRRTSAIVDSISERIKALNVSSRNNIIEDYINVSVYLTLTLQTSSDAVVL